MRPTLAVALALACIASTTHAAPLRCPPGSAQWTDSWGNRTCRNVDSGQDGFIEQHFDLAGPQSSVPRDNGSSKGSAYYRALRRDPFRE
jgi:hypothetical protein